MSDHRFCLTLKTCLMVEVRDHTTVAERKAAWTWMSSCFKNSGDFHGPNKFYWHGQGCCKWMLAYYGWSAWLKAEGHND